MERIDDDRKYVCILRLTNVTMAGTNVRRVGHDRTAIYLIYNSNKGQFED